MIAIGQRRRLAATPSPRRGWPARLAAWLCLLALVANQVTPLAVAAAQTDGDTDFICHAGTEPGRPLPVSDDGASQHCAFCVVLAAQALAPPAESPRPAAPPDSGASPIPSLAGSAQVAPPWASPKQSRAPPSLA